MTQVLEEWVIRVQVTPDQKRRLRQLAIERDQELREMFTDALQTSPLTATAFTDAKGATE